MKFETPGHGMFAEEGYRQQASLRGHVDFYQQVGWGHSSLLVLASCLHLFWVPDKDILILVLLGYVLALV
jgi:hypothetical protein